MNIDMVQSLPTGLATGTINFCITSPPVLNPIGNQIAIVGRLFTLNVSASDADNDTLTFVDNATFFDINSTTGLITFTPTGSDLGTHTINISVNESGCGLIDYEIITFTVIHCGNGVCDFGEDCSSCPDDCGTCPSPRIGDGGFPPAPPSPPTPPPPIPPTCPICPKPSPWSTCRDNEQIRINYQCDVTTNYECQSYEETIFCELPPTPLIIPLGLGIGLIVVIAILAIVIFIILKKRKLKKVRTYLYIYSCNIKYYK